MIKHAFRAGALLLALAASGMALAQETSERVADEGTIGDKWMLAEGVPLAQAQYPPRMAARGDNACIALSYLIGKDGSTSDFAMVKAWNSESGEQEPVDGFWAAFAQAGAEAVSQWQFKPRPEVTNAMPTRTVATLGFQGAKGGKPAEVNAHCRIDGLRSYLAQLESERSRTSNDMARHDLDKVYQAQRRSEKGFEGQGLRGRFSGERTGRTQ
jgi:hypothetical protein